MIELLQYITSTLQGIHPQTYYDMNTEEAVSYPYVTFDVDSEPRENQNEELVTIDLDIFDHSNADSGPGYMNIFEIESKLKKALIKRRDLTEDLNAMWIYVRSTNVPTRDLSLTRRSMTFQIRLDWRKI